MTRQRHASVCREPQDAPHHCGKRMTLRFNRRTGEAFYGCAAYPLCRVTAPAKVKEPDWFGKAKGVPK